MTLYNTNLASEFHVLSMLHRYGLNAALTLGNKKAVDIFVFREDKTSYSIEVKGVAKKYDWPADNVDLKGKKGHFIVLVCFDGKITDPTYTPSTWAIPSKKISTFIKEYKTRTVVSRALMVSKAEDYKDAWEKLTA